MSETYFMGKPLTYWLKLEETFGDVQEDPQVLLAVSEAKLALLESNYTVSKLRLESDISLYAERVLNGE
jgi:hypothetical protein